MSNLNIIEKYVKDNVQKVDLEIVSKESVGGKALFRASIDNAEGGNLCTGGWEYSLEEALEELVKELKNIDKQAPLTEKLTGKE